MDGVDLAQHAGLREAPVRERAAPGSKRRGRKGPTVASSEAEEVWQMLKEARVAGGANNFAHQRDRASRASDMISAPFGATYTSEALEGDPRAAR